MWIPTQAELSAAMIGSSLIALKPYLQRSLQTVTNAFGSLVRTINSRSVGTKGSVGSQQHSQGISGGVPTRSTDKYVRMGESRTALNEEFELEGRNQDQKRG
jgi:hypothetical protein